MSALKRINNEINRKFPKNVLDLSIPYTFSFTSSNIDFTNIDNIQVSIDVYNNSLFTMTLTNRYPFIAPNVWISTKYGVKNYNRWCADITSIINRRNFLSTTNILLASFFSIDINTKLFKRFINIPTSIPINCLCCNSVICPQIWNPGCQIKDIIEEFIFNKKFLFYTSELGIKLLMPIFYNDKWNIPEDILIHIFLFII